MSAAHTNAVVVRPVRWPDDEPGLFALDPSFTSDRIYRVEQTDFSFRFVDQPVDPPLYKRFEPLAAFADELRGLRHVVVAESGNALLGIAAADLSAWNRRVYVPHVYVTSTARRKGIGRALMSSVLAFAGEVGARCVWLETQNTNYPAIQFYLRLGFHLCGCDDRLYEPVAESSHETALFFALDLAD